MAKAKGKGARAARGPIDPSIPVVFVADRPEKLIEQLYAFSDGMPRRADGEAAYTMSFTTFEDVGSGEMHLMVTLWPRPGGLGQVTH